MHAIFYKRPSQILIMFVSEIEGTTVDSRFQEAYERSQEIGLAADQEAAKLRRRIVQSGKAKINEQMEERLTKIRADKKIFVSSCYNHYRTKRITHQFKLCEKIFREVESRLADFAKSSEHRQAYEQFLVTSIVQGLVRMFEERIDIRCRSQDAEIVSRLIPLCQEAYDCFMMEQIGVPYPTELQVAKNCSLLERDLSKGELLKEEEGNQCIGGVILADTTGNITLKATLDSRFNILRESCLPLVRQVVWGQSQNSNSANDHSS